MSEFILLLDRSKCPNCSRQSTPKGLGQCRSCGMMLFDKTNNFKGYEDSTGWREYWVYTGRIEGWKHRSHLFDEDSKPLVRVYEVPELSTDYGTKKYIDRKLDDSRIELKEAVKQLKKKRVTVAVK